MTYARIVDSDPGAFNFAVRLSQRLIDGPQHHNAQETIAIISPA